MKIYLYKVGRNLNRTIRLAHSFGFDKLYIVECEHKVKGNLFSAKNVKLVNSHLPSTSKTLVFEVDGKITIDDIKVSDYDNIIIGGESINLKNEMGLKVKIPTVNKLCLTTESALSIILYKYNHERTI